MRPTQLFRGHLVEAVHLAFARPEEERARLFVTFEQNDHRLSWTAIAKLATRADFPMMI